MDLVEVDVRLFITCRMCLEEPGRYPIVPSIKEDIKYCFDIDIEPFDGLPQLICKKCKLTLTEHKTTKSTFIQKQQKLREKLLKKNDHASQPSQEIIDCTSEDDEIKIEPLDTPDEPDIPDEPVKPDEPVNTAISVEPAPTVTAVATVRPVVPQDNSKQVNDLLKKKYNEHFICNICSKGYQKHSSIKRHVSTHKKIINKYKKTFKNYCIVRLNKIDDKENCIGVSNVVVYNREKIIANHGNSRFHTFYLKNKRVTAEKGSSAAKRPGVFSDSSDDEICKGKKKSRRLLSCSSTQTTVLEESKADCNISNNLDEKHDQNNSKNADLVNTGCRNIDDTCSDCPPKSKLEPEKSMVLRKKRAKAKIANYKAIQKIVSMCHKKYIKKAQSESEMSNKLAFSESSLKHKVLSLGRKVIHKQGFGCTGLLRYMEHKDLEITWQPTSHDVQNKGSSFVRIMTKLKSREDSENDELGWKDMHEISFSSDRKEVPVVNPDVNNTTTPTITTNEEESKTLSLGGDQNEDQSDNLLSTSDLNNKNNKLLNTSPVPNPKQLPKKLPASDTKPVTIKHNDVNTAMVQPTHESEELDNAGVDEINFRMPIITSTQSLSTVTDVDITKDKADHSIDKPTPRIKVKPASELMSERALNNQDITEDIWAFSRRHMSLPYHLPSAVYVAAPMPQSQAGYQANNASAIVATGTSTNVDKAPADKTNIGDAKNKKPEYVTLDCLELPNTKTKSPFQYFKTLLMYHGLNLMELNEELSANFYCLVRFKLLLRQDTKRPLEVVLSLFCSDNSFCFNFKDCKLKTFDANQLPAHWQWELLKIYKGDIENKILQNAEKISKEVHDNTKNFLCLLKSINFIRE